MSDLLDRLKPALADRYTVERELGSGGMATVYLARDLRHNRSVAVKVLRPELTAALGAERFLREVQITARLQHPHILPAFLRTDLLVRPDEPDRGARDREIPTEAAVGEVQTDRRRRTRTPHQCDPH